MGDIVKGGSGLSPNVYDNFTKIPEYRPWGKVSRIILAILRDAVPDQIEEFRRIPNKSLSGIRLRTK